MIVVACKYDQPIVSIAYLPLTPTSAKFDGRAFRPSTIDTMAVFDNIE